MMVPVITSGRILQEFRLLDHKAQLMIERELIPEGTINVYLIGGGNMALRRIKNATKDIDVVLKNHEAYEVFDRILTDISVYSNVNSALSKVVYLKVQDHEYTRSLGAIAVYQKIDPNDQDFNLDVFVKRVGEKLYLSDTMMKRATLVRQLRNLQVLRVYQISKEDIFLFKGVTSVERTRDIDDMKRLIESGLDFRVLSNELQVQKKLLMREPCKYLHLLNLICEKVQQIKDDFSRQGLETKSLDQFVRLLLGLPITSTRKRRFSK